MALTREQHLAIWLPCHLSVMANAGSGKTRVLVDRYVNLILSDNREPRRHDPNKIVAITFTRKAAAEMLARAVAEIERMTQTAEPRDLPMLKRIRERLTNAKISTIHSFCSSLLRDYPIEAGIVPNFTELTEAELRAVERDSILEIIEESLDSADSNERGLAREIANRFGIPRIQDYISRLVASRGKAEFFTNFYNKDNYEHVIAGNIGFITSYITDLLDTMLPRLLQSATGVASTLDKVKSEKLQKPIDILKIIIEASESAKGSKSIERLSGLIKLAQEFFTQKTGSKKFTNYIIDIALDGSAEMKEKVEDCIKSIGLVAESLEYSDFDAMLVQYAAFFNRMSTEAASRIEEEKLAVNGLDFDDLIIKVKSLLSNPDVGRKIIRNISHLLVDEFQDTDPLQYEIIKRLVPDLDSDVADGSPPQLFIVGDAKQGIYGFRDADVRLFDRARGDLIKANSSLPAPDSNQAFGQLTKTLSPTAAELSGDLRLQATFRLKPALAAFINYLCGNLFTESKTEFDVDYEEFVVARNADIIIKELNSTAVEPAKNVSNSRIGSPGNYLELGDRFGSVSFLVNEINDKVSIGVDSRKGSIDLEADMLVRYILKITGSLEPLQIEGSGISRSVRFGDIAVLLRTSKGLKPLSEALIRSGIPYKIHSGSGYYQAQEVVDVVSILKFLHNTGDDLSLASALKSPFFGLNDTELLELASRRDGGTLWEKLARYCGNNNNDNISGTEEKSPLIPLLQRGNNNFPPLESDFENARGTEEKSPFIPLSQRGKNNFPPLEKGENQFPPLEKGGRGDLSPNESDGLNYIKIHRAYSKLSEILPYALRMPVSLLVMKIIDACSWQGSIAANPARSQIEANIEKLIQLAREFESRGFRNLYDFVENFDQIAAVSKEPEAAHVTSENTVNIMTIHASKGLEFPVVALFNTNSRGRPEYDLLIDDSNCITFPVPVETADYGETGFVVTPLHYGSKQRRRMAEKAEEKRILYVALTRARDRLIISTTLVAKDNAYKKPTGMLKSVLKGLKLSTDHIYAIPDGQGLTIEQKLKITSPAGITEAAVAVPVSVYKSITAEEQDFATIQAMPDSKPVLLDEFAANRQDELFSATKISTYLIDRSGYAAKYRLGLPDTEDDDYTAPPIAPDGEGDEIVGSLAGTFIHKALENIRVWLNPEGRVDQPALAEIIKNAAAATEKFIPEKALDRIYSECRAVVSTRLLKAYCNQLFQARCELSLTVPISGDLFTGTIDLIIKKIDGEWEIWDWKSNRINESRTMEYYADCYRSQLEAYCWLLWLLYPMQNQYIARLCFTRLATGDAPDEAWTYKFTWSKDELAAYDGQLAATIRSISNSEGFLSIKA